MKSDYDIVTFQDQALFHEWLDVNHSECNGIWIQIYKKATAIPTVNHAEALDVALCYGWIDGQRKGFDEVSFLQKFTPRRPKSLWSKRNIEFIDRLTNAGLMKPSGIAEVELAQKDGRWDAAYDKPSEMKIPEDLLLVLETNSKAKEFFQTLNKTNTYAICWQLQTAKKPETRQRRLQKILSMLESGEKLH